MVTASDVRDFERLPFDPDERFAAECPNCEESIYPPFEVNTDLEHECPNCSAELVANPEKMGTVAFHSANIIENRLGNVVTDDDIEVIRGELVRMNYATAAAEDGYLEGDSPIVRVEIGGHRFNFEDYSFLLAMTMVVPAGFMFISSISGLSFGPVDIGLVGVLFLLIFVLYSLENISTEEKGGVNA